MRIDKKNVGKARVVRLAINKYVYASVLVCAVMFGLMYLYFRYVIPTERVAKTSHLVMQGDLNGDKVWDAKDKAKLDRMVDTPWDYSDSELAKVDINRNQTIDAEDIGVLTELYSVSNPYKLFADDQGPEKPAPKVRELFQYKFVEDFVPRPTFGLDHAAIHGSPFAFLSGIRDLSFDSPYLQRLSREIYDEALRSSFIYAQRKDQLSVEEQTFVRDEIEVVERLYEAKDYYNLLLQLILLSEAGETLSTHNQSEFVKNARLLAQEFRLYLVSPEYAAFVSGEAAWETVFADLDRISAETMGIELELATLESPRDLTEIQNYVDRAEWQSYKSKTGKDDFRELVKFAQNDRRYLRAVSNTTERHNDVALENHNLPMMLLFGQAMDITGNEKKAAVGLLDEAIRIPFFWVKSLPENLRPSSVALEHFLLPGNMEDGSDKSRHWNVFGGLSLYRSPEESLTLAFQREVEDVRNANYAPDAMTEFIRDMIANFYGIYHIVSYDPI